MHRINRNGISKGISRRLLLQALAATGLLAGVRGLMPAYARQGSGDEASAVRRSGGDAVDLAIRRTALNIGGRKAAVTTINGSLPGPLLRFREGDTAILRVANQLNEDTSLHWHGVLVPAAMDGVPGVSFAGIKPGETFTYRFPVRQSGTYWYHSHSGTQEPAGVYGPLIIDPLEAEPFEYDQDYVVMLSDWSFEDPYDVLAKLKKQSGYYNYQKQTLADFFRDLSSKGWSAAVSDRLAWAKMRMDPTDIADVTGYTYTYLINGLAPRDNWTGLFKPGERLRLRFINGAAMTYFDVRIPGLKLTAVQADGQNIQPVAVDEFRIAAGETYDVLVEPGEDRAYTLFAEAMDRSGYARGTLAPRLGMSAPIPERRPRPLRTLVDMGMAGMDDMPGMNGAGGAHDMRGAPAMPEAKATTHGMTDMDMPSHDMAGATGMEPSGQGMNGGSQMDMPEVMTADKASGGSQALSGTDHPPSERTMMNSRIDEPGTGLENSGTRVLVYGDLRSVKGGYDPRPPEREIELHLTGNMERYIWSFDGKKYSEVHEPIPFKHGERLRITFVNDTMMDHPIHLHGMWMDLDNGAGRHKPRKHTISVKPAERLAVEVTADAMGKWALHCHLFYHMTVGMFREVAVTDPLAEMKK